MRSGILLAAVLVLAGTLAFPSVAAPLFGGGDNVSEDVTLAPAQGSNGDYSYLENADLVIDLSASNPNVSGEGVNDAAVTGISNVFVINYTGDQYAHVWLTHESDAVTFFARGHAIHSEANNVTLGPNDSVAVGLRVDTTGDETDGLIDDITIHAKVAEPQVQSQSYDPPLSVSSFSPGATTRRYRVTGADYGEVVALATSRLLVDRLGQNATLTLDGLEVTADDSLMSLDVSVANSSDRQFAVNNGLEALGTVVVDMDTGQTRGATFEFSVDRAYLDARGIRGTNLVVYRDDGDGDGWHELETRVVGEEGDRVQFEADTPGFSRFFVAARVPDIQVTETRIEPWTIAPNESATVTAEVTNKGASSGTRTIDLAVDDTVVATQTVSLDAGNTTTVNFTISPELGQHAIRVGDTDAGTLWVETEPSTTTTETGTSTTTNQTETSTTTPPPTTSTPTTSTQTQEALGFGSDDIAGLITFLAIVLGMAFLVRRAPWG